ncbi:hypothetical protein CRG98_020891 [Punica granatum]|uniref:Uncharacterized protein n=1 Tax=Punica granatum TaxID=22663 RepID=A0A2I0JR21_PUNGR|nr:hypothetical protein CRG98_020891 [Punica granatum]
MNHQCLNYGLSIREPNNLCLLMRSFQGDVDGEEAGAAFEGGSYDEDEIEPRGALAGAEASEAMGFEGEMVGVESAASLGAGEGEI